MKAVDNDYCREAVMVVLHKFIAGSPVPREDLLWLLDRVVGFYHDIEDNDKPKVGE